MQENRRAWGTISTIRISRFKGGRGYFFHSLTPPMLFLGFLGSCGFVGGGEEGEKSMVVVVLAVGGLGWSV